ncbi:Helix-turn-helix domain-containing protein [Pararobbsia alpina]|uniref:DNA-binding response regulator n=1 Tax=Pararobbsia alpina TaxID=621374 RepID=UPI0039A45FD2
MNSSTHVVFLAREDDTLVNLARDLSRLGFAIHLHRDPGTLHSAFVLDACPLIFVGLAPNEINDAVMKVRALHPTGGVIAYSTFKESEQRVRTLMCGADYCVEPDMSAVEIAALMRALVRRGNDILASATAVSHAISNQEAHARRGMSPSSAQSLWRLANKGWTLVAPSGRALALTAGERELVQRFFSAPDRKIRREWDSAIDASSSVDPSSPGNVSPRVIDVMISRLRRKASQKQMGLPIRSVPGWGYVFAGDIEAVDDAQADQAYAGERDTQCQ